MTGTSTAERAAQILAETDLCAGLSQHELEELGSIAELRQLETGGKLCRSGERGSEAFVVASGSVEVFVGDDGDRRVIATLKPYQVLGELSLIEPGPRTANASATGPTLVLVLSWEGLQELRDVMSSAAFKLIRALSITICARIRDINAQIDAERAANPDFAILGEEVEALETEVPTASSDSDSEQQERGLLAALSRWWQRGS